MSKVSWHPTHSEISATSQTSNATAEIFPPAARIAAAATSTSSLERAAITTSAPASASAQAHANPNPRPAPVTSALRSSSRKEGVRRISGMATTLAGMASDYVGWRVRGRRVRPHILATIAPEADIGLLGMPVKPFKHAQPRTMLTHLDSRRVGEHALIGARL